MARTKSEDPRGFEYKVRLTAGVKELWDALVSGSGCKNLSDWCQEYFDRVDVKPVLVERDLGDEMLTINRLNAKIKELEGRLASAPTDVVDVADHSACDEREKKLKSVNKTLRIENEELIGQVRSLKSGLTTAVAPVVERPALSSITGYVRPKPSASGHAPNCRCNACTGMLKAEGGKSKPKGRSVQTEGD